MKATINLWENLTGIVEASGFHRRDSWRDADMNFGIGLIEPLEDQELVQEEVEKERYQEESYLWRQWANTPVTE